MKMKQTSKSILDKLTAVRRALDHGVSVAMFKADAAAREVIPIGTPVQYTLADASGTETFQSVTDRSVHYLCRGDNYYELQIPVDGYVFAAPTVVLNPHEDDEQGGLFDEGDS